MSTVTVHVEVTQEDISRGNHACCTCPVALAMKRAIGCNDAAVAGGVFAIQQDGCGRHDGHLPDIAVQFIADFDGLRAVAPFSFDVEIPEEYIKAA